MFPVTIEITEEMFGARNEDPRNCAGKVALESIVGSGAISWGVCSGIYNVNESPNFKWIGKSISSLKESGFTEIKSTKDGQAYEMVDCKIGDQVTFSLVE